MRPATQEFRKSGFVQEMWREWMGAKIMTECNETNNMSRVQKLVDWMRGIGWKSPTTYAVDRINSVCARVLHMDRDRRAGAEGMKIDLLPGLVEKVRALATALDLSPTGAITHILQVYFVALRDREQATERLERTEQAIHRAYYDDRIDRDEAEVLLGESEAAGLEVFKERQNRDYMKKLEEIEG